MYFFVITTAYSCQSWYSGWSSQKICLSHRNIVFSSLWPDNILEEYCVQKFAKRFLEEVLNLMSSTEGVTKLLIIQRHVPCPERAVGGLLGRWPLLRTAAGRMKPRPVENAWTDAVSVTPFQTSVSQGWAMAHPLCLQVLWFAFSMNKGRDSSAVTEGGLYCKHLPTWTLTLKAEAGGLPPSDTAPHPVGIWGCYEFFSRQCDETELGLQFQADLGSSLPALPAHCLRHLAGHFCEHQRG